MHPVERALAASVLVPRDGVVLAAVSGGADSMAMLDALRAMQRGRLVVAHFDHRLRKDSARDAEHVAAYARKHGLEFVLGTEDIAQRARAQRTSIEETARDARYEFFEEIAERLRAACVATAHTRSDQIETILMRILRGSGRVGVAGIPEKRDIFVRPLLGVTRTDTRDYCTSRGVPFVDDPSNQAFHFLRNRIRHETLPQLRTAFPRIDETLVRLADSARREERAFAERTTGWLNENFSEESPGVWALRLTGFAAIDDDDATALLREALARAGCARNVGRAHYLRLLELVRDRHAGSSADLPGLSARREHDAVVLHPRPAAGVADGAPDAPGGGVIGDRTHRAAFTQVLAIPGRAQVAEWIVETEYVSADEARRNIAAQSKGPLTSEVYLDAAAITLPLIARPRHPGDAMRPLGLGGRKKLSDLFIDLKIPRRRRERAIVIEGAAIYWVPGVAKSDLVRIHASTTLAVRMKATRVQST